MNALAPHEVLRAWETAAAAPAPLRGAAIVAAAGNGTLAEMSDLPLGELARRLLALRAAQFGDPLTALAECPQCARPVELHFRTSDLAGAPEPSAPVFAEADGRRLELRVPTSRDLFEAVKAGADPAASSRRLFLRCLVTARDAAGRDLMADALDADAEGAAAAALAEADPRADLELGLDCPHCGRDWTAPFDPAAFLFAELAAEARRLLRDVHELAVAYGWSEAEIVGLTPARRAAYLELVRG